MFLSFLAIENLQNNCIYQFLIFNFSLAMQIFKACKFDYEGPTPYFSLIKDKCLVKLDEDNIQNQF
jgi:hypothetical protein